MKIHLTPSTAGRYGGSLKGNLRYFAQFIQNKLDDCSFRSSFEELWLTLSYPPMYVLPGVVGIEKDFKIYYDSFPYSRLDRRYKKIEITLIAPEFSEHFDKKDQAGNVNTFEIEPQYKNFDEIDLARILVDKFIIAVEIIRDKLKKEDIFDYGIFINLLHDIKQKINPEFLHEINLQQTEEANNAILKRALGLRDLRRAEEKSKDKLIRDFRVYYSGLPEKALYPFDYIYSEIFRNKLIREQLMCPTYHHLYVQVGRTMDEVLKNSFAIEDWYVNGLATIDFEAYKSLEEKMKEKVVFSVIAAGLRDIAYLDRLDIDKISKIIKEIEETGQDTELVFNIIESKKYILKVTYFSRSMEEQCPIFFNLMEKATQYSIRKQIGKAQNHQLRLWLQKITITGKQIKVRSSTAVEGEVLLKGKPTSMEFEIADLMA